jgi:hypothetical protein
MFAADSHNSMAALLRGLPVPGWAGHRHLDRRAPCHPCGAEEAHPKLAVGWGVSVQDYQAEPGTEHVLEDYRHPRDEVFLEAARGDDWVGVQTYTRIRVAVRDGDQFYPDALGGALRRTADFVGGTPIIALPRRRPSNNRVKATVRDGTDRPQVMTARSPHRVRGARLRRRRGCAADEKAFVAGLGRSPRRVARPLACETDSLLCR